MIEKYPETKYTNDLNTNPIYNPYFYALFDTMIDPIDKRYLSEDYMFCQWVNALDMDIWLCPWMQLQHVGSYVFGGSLADLASIGASATADESKLKKKKVATNPK